VALFTIVLDYRGGTYIRQLKAASAKRALILSVPKFNLFKEKIGQGVADEVNQGNLVPIEGTTNVWCSSALARGHVAIFHVIETSAER
jgi:hypothetical protein